MVSVKTVQNGHLTDKDALRAMALQRHLEAVAEEINTTISLLDVLGIDAEISISQEGAAPGN